MDVAGVVEDATIESGGNVQVAAGFLGRNKGAIKAKGDVMLRFCENQAIEAGNDVLIGDSLLHSTVRASGWVRATTGKGQIIGGHIIATAGVEALALGNAQHPKTVIRVGMDPAARLELARIERALQDNQSNLDRVEQALVQLEKLQLLRKRLPPDKAKLLEKVIETRDRLTQERELLPPRREALLADMAKHGDATVRVSGTVYPGVVIQIGKERLDIQDAIKEVEFALQGEQVAARPLES